MQLQHFKIRLHNDFLEEDQQKLNAFIKDKNVLQTSSTFITGVNEFWSVLVFFEGIPTNENKEKSTKTTFPSITNSVKLSEQENQLFQSLKEWRAAKAEKLKMPQYMICHNSELLSIVKLQPKSPEDLTQVKGFGDLKRMKYGNEIIQLLQAC
ncbi:MAG: HRDC domain-containing protein [Flavobacterium sp.]